MDITSVKAGLRAEDGGPHVTDGIKVVVVIAPQVFAVDLEVEFLD